MEACVPLPQPDVPAERRALTVSLNPAPRAAQAWQRGRWETPALLTLSPLRAPCWVLATRLTNVAHVLMLHLAQVWDLSVGQACPHPLSWLQGTCCSFAAFTGGVNVAPISCLACRLKVRSDDLVLGRAHVVAPSSGGIRECYLNLFCLW